MGHDAPQETLGVRDALGSRRGHDPQAEVAERLRHPSVVRDHAGQSVAKPRARRRMDGVKRPERHRLKQRRPLEDVIVHWCECDAIHQITGADQ